MEKEKKGEGEVERGRRREAQIENESMNSGVEESLVRRENEVQTNGEGD